MAGPLVDRIRLATVLGLKSLDDRTWINPGLRYIQRVARRRYFLLGGVGHRAADDFFDHAADALLAEPQERDGVVDVAATDQIHQQTSFPRRNPSVAMFGLVGHRKPLCCRCRTGGS